MSESDGKLSLISVGDWSKPANTLVEKISDAIGGIAKPWQIKRVAEAEAIADRIQTTADIERAERLQRAAIRFLAEETKKQENIESIISKALPEVSEQAKPEQVEDDWIANFFDKCRLISDDDMQKLWAKLLSGEANSPGRFSKRTINLVASLDKSDARMFSTLCSFTCCVGQQLVPVIFDYTNQIYSKSGIDYSFLAHLESIGLIRFNYAPKHVYTIDGLEQEIVIDYFGQNVFIRFDSPNANEFAVGQVLFTQAGEQLSSICGAKRQDGFFEYLNTIWKGDGLPLITSDMMVPLELMGT